MARIGLHSLDHTLQNFVPNWSAHLFAELANAFAHVARAGVFGAVDAVAKSCDGFAGSTFGFDVGGSLVWRADFLHHFHHIFSSAAVGGASECGEGCDHGAVQVGFCSDSYARGKGRRVCAVFGVEDEVHICEACGILRWELAFEHIEPVGGVTERGVCGHRRAAISDMFMRRDDHGHLRGQAYAVFYEGIFTHVLTLWFKGRKG